MRCAQLRWLSYRHHPRSIVTLVDEGVDEGAIVTLVDEGVDEGAIVTLVDEGVDGGAIGFRTLLVDEGVDEGHMFFSFSFETCLILVLAFPNLHLFWHLVELLLADWYLVSPRLQHACARRRSNEGFDVATRGALESMCGRLATNCLTRALESTCGELERTLREHVLSEFAKMANLKEH